MKPGDIVKRKGRRHDLDSYEYKPQSNSYYRELGIVIEVRSSVEFYGDKKFEYPNVTVKWANSGLLTEIGFVLEIVQEV